jgi:hypothetical protein
VTHKSLASIVISLIIGVASPAIAQDEPLLTITPFVGVYIPTGSLVNDQMVPDPGPLDPDAISTTQETGLAVGLRASRSLSSSWWLELEIQYAKSDVTINATRREPLPEPTKTMDARVLTLGGNVLWEVYRAPFTPFAIHLLGGLALVNRGGKFFEEGGGFFDSLDGGTDISLILGSGLRYGLSPRYGIRFDVRDYISSYTQTLPTGQLDAELQNDFWISGGLEITL